MQPTKPLSPKSTNGIKDATGKAHCRSDWIGTAKSSAVMRQLGLKAKIRAKKAYRHPAMGEISEHLLKRRFQAQKPNEKWLTDVTELKGSDGKLYLANLGLVQPRDRRLRREPQC